VDSSSPSLETRSEGWQVPFSYRGITDPCRHGAERVRSTIKGPLRPVFVRVNCASPRVGLALQVDTWPGDEIAHELIAKIQTHLPPAIDNPSLAAPVAFTPEFDVAVFCLHVGNGAKYTQEGC
jgi:hypothetical protein